MGSTRVDAPEPRDYGQETRDTLQAQLELAPAKFASEALWGPQYQDLQLQMLAKATPQLMEIFNQVAPQLSRAEVDSTRMAREGDITAVRELGPQARAAIGAASPQEAALVDKMVGQAGAGLDAGTALTPEQQRLAQQQSRQAFADRGLVGSPRSAIDEIVRSQVMGAGEQQRRLGNASQALGQSQMFYGDQFQQILGRPSQAFGMTQGLTGQAQGFNPGQLFNPESQYAADIYNQSWQGNLAARQATAANKTAITGAAIGAAGQVASSL